MKIIKINESQNKRLFKEGFEKVLLREYMAVWRDDAITELAKQIANDFAPLNMKTKIDRNKLFKAKYNLYLGSKEIPIVVTYTIDGDGWDGVYHGSKKDIVLNLYGKITASNVLTGLYHEITHALDHDLEDKINKRIGYYYGNNYIRLKGRRSETCEAINVILYKLWAFTERNAYQSHALYGVKYCQSYINELKDEIDYLATHTNKNEDVIFNDLKNKFASKWDRDGYSYVGNKRMLNSNWKAFKRFFIKKSYALLKKFGKKLINNAYKAQEEGLVVQLTPNENSDIFNSFKKENDKVEDKIRKYNEKKELLRQARIEKVVPYLKDFSSREDETLEILFTEIVQNICEDRYGEKARYESEPDEEAKRNRAYYYYEYCYFHTEELDIIKTKHSYNLDYYLVFNGSNDSQFAISDYNGKYVIDIYSKDFNKIMIEVISNSIIYEFNGSFYRLGYDKKIMFSEINRRKHEIISLLKKLLHELYSFVIKKEYTLSLKLKDREVNLSAPSREELAVKLRNEFPKWNDTVINNWVNKATEN